MVTLNTYIRECNKREEERYADNPELYDAKDLFDVDANDGTFLMNFEDWR